jgi:membrane-associated protease RseP (regulator of RpoE activity)
LASIPPAPRPDNVTPEPTPPASPPVPEAPEEGPGEDAKLTFGEWFKKNRFYLIALALLAGLLYWKFGLTGTWNLVLAGLGLGFVIFIHELGHFAVAKWCDVHVETFSVGFGPALPGCQFKWGETVYKLALFPLGGYVKMLGEGDDEGGENNPRSYKNKKVRQRMAIISAGVIMNVILAAVCFTVAFTLGKERKAGVFGMIDSGKEAWRKGIPAGAKLKQVGSRVGTPKRPVYFDDLLRAVLATADGEQLKITYEVYEPLGSPDAKPSEYTALVTPPTEESAFGKRPMIGVSWAPSLKLMPEKARATLHRPYPPKSAAAAARAATPELHRGAVVLASSDPNAPAEWMNFDPPVEFGSGDEFALAQRFQELTDRPLKLRVRRGAEVKDVEVPLASFDFGDRIVAMTNPEKGYEVDPLPPDPRQPGSGELDYFAYRRRLQLLAGQFAVIRVERANHTTQDLLVPPAYHATLGVRMGLGPVLARREGSKAVEAGVEEKDLLQEVVLADAATGERRQFVLSRGDSDPADQVVGGLGAARLRSAPLLVDPLRLPDELRAWAHGREKVMVTLTVLRTDNGKERAPKTLPPVEWDKRWEFDNEQPLAATSPLAIPELGLAFRVETRVEEGPPAGDGLREGDVIKGFSVKGYKFEADGSVADLEQEDKKTLEADQWAWAFSILQQHKVRELKLTVERKDGTHEVAVMPEPDRSWPLVERGLGPVYLQDQTVVQKADGVGDAVWMGADETVGIILDVYYTIRGILTGRISMTNMGGPVTIGVVAYQHAGTSFVELIFFLGMISANLAVINFLPVPFLDGGHMMFLTYEGLRGKPAPETVQLILTYAGIIMLLLLMGTVIVMDVLKVRMFFF